MAGNSAVSAFTKSQTDYFFSALAFLSFLYFVMISLELNIITY